MKQSNAKKIMKRFGMVLLIVLSGIILWFLVPYSPLRTQFEHQIEEELETLKPQKHNVLHEALFEAFPPSIQAYMKQSGFLGKPAMTYVSLVYHDVDFRTTPSQSLTIDYTQYNFVQPISRYALIQSQKMGIPFEGLDTWNGEEAHMKGLLGKAIPLFDQTGEDLEQGTLVTYLSEILFAPSALLQADIQMHQLGEHMVEATLTHGGQSVKGTFFFNERFEMTSFESMDRKMMGQDGQVQSLPWSARCHTYRKDENGLNLPRHLQAVWIYPDHEEVYFSGEISSYHYG